MKYILIGQKNVGKSSIFNRILENKINIVNPIKGSTRDWIEQKKIYKDKIIYLIDTPGINPLSGKLYDKKILLYIKDKITADITILFVVEVKNYENEIDDEILRFVRKFNKNIVLIINKTDNKKLELNAYNFSKFGIKKTFCISCSHNLGIDMLISHLFNRSKIFLNTNDEIIKDELSIGVYGKPNVGKSTFINKFLGFERFQTANTPGLTTDSIYQLIKYKNKNIKIFDTAGIKSKNKFKNSLEVMSSNISIKNISYTTIGILIIDCNNALDRQDKKIINLISKRGKFLIIVFNKIDLISDKEKLKVKLLNQIRNEIFQLKNLKCFFISSLNTDNVKKIFNYICFSIVLDNTISTSKINYWLKKTTNEHPHPLIRGKKVSFKYALQVNTSPIKIKVFSNYSKKIIESYKRYLKNSFIDYFKIKDQNIKIFFSNTKNPYINN